MGKHSFLRILWLGAIVFLVIMALMGTWLFLTQPLPFRKDVKRFVFLPSPEPGLTLERDAASEDAAQLIEIVETCHPIFLDGYPPGYERAKREFLAVAPAAGTIGEFRGIAQKYLTAIQDGHTSLFSSGDRRFLNLLWTWDGTAFRIVTGEGLPEGARVTTINGKDSSALIAAVDSIVPQENKSGTMLAHDYDTRTAEAFRAAGFPEADTVTLGLMTPSGEAYKTLPFEIPETAKQNSGPTAEGRTEGGAFVFTLRSCRLDESLDRAIAALKESISAGTRRVIVDVRGNPGGNSMAPMAVLNAMGMTPGNYGSVIRFSPLASEQRGYLRKTGSISNKPQNRARFNKSLELYVITDETTFSSAAMLAVWISDGNLGKLVGRPSSNSPSCYGDTLYYTLSNSTLSGSVSHKKWIRPNVSKDTENILSMDIPVPAGTDELRYLLETLGEAGVSTQ